MKIGTDNSRRGVKHVQRYFRRLLPDLGEIRYKISARNAVDHKWVLWKSGQERPYFLMGRK